MRARGRHGCCLTATAFHTRVGNRPVQPTVQHQPEDVMSNRKGFTLIELLIVVVIIGILAAIAIPKFSNTKEKAVVAAMKSDLRNYASAEESYYSDYTSYANITANTTYFKNSAGNTITGTAS